MAEKACLSGCEGSCGHLRGCWAVGFWRNFCVLYLNIRIVDRKGQEPVDLAWVGEFLLTYGWILMLLNGSIFSFHFIKHKRPLLSTYYVFGQEGEVIGNPSPQPQGAYKQHGKMSELCSQPHNISENMWHSIPQLLLTMPRQGQPINAWMPR